MEPESKPNLLRAVAGPRLPTGTGIASLPGVRQAVVLSGGGAKGAYEVGVIKALVEGQASSTGGLDVDPAIYTGTSVGGYNAAFLAARGEIPVDQAVEELIGIWRHRIANTAASCGNGVYRIRGAPLQFLDPGCLRHPFANLMDLGRDAVSLGESFGAHAAAFAVSDLPIQNRLLRTIDIAAFFDPDPLYELIEQTIDFQALGRSTKALNLVASNWHTGRAVVFDRAEVTYHGGAAVRATAAIPTLFPPVEIDDHLLVDGGVTMNTPVRPAIVDGADVIHVIFVDPFIQDIPFPPVPNTIDDFYRLYVILVADNLNGDVLAAAVINEELRVLEALDLTPAQRRAALARAAEIAPRDDLSPLVGILRRLRSGRRPRRLIEIHKYRPVTELGGAAGLLDFSLDAVEESYREGFLDATRHDCHREGCVLVAPHELRVSRLVA